MNFLLFNNFAISAAVAWFDLANGVVGTVSSGFTAAITAVGGGWYRCSVAGFSAATGPYITMAVADADNSNLSTASGTNGVLLWGAQLEAVTYQTTPRTYIPTTSAAVYGPRLDYDPVTTEPKGLLIEESRQNVMTYSEQFDNAVWIKSGILAFGSGSVANAITAPDGTLSADKIVESTTASVSHGLLYSYSPIAGTVYTFSLYAKAAERPFVQLAVAFGAQTSNAYFNLSAGALGTVTGGTASIQNVGNGWYRCVFTLTAANSTVGYWVIRTASADNTITYTSDGVSGLYVWGAQLEVGASFVTSYIPTSSASVTRNADVATVTGSNFSTPWSAVNGTFLTTFDTPASGTRPVLNVDNNTANNQIQIYTSSTAATYSVSDGGVTQATIALGTVNSTSAYTIAAEYKANDFSAAMGGVLGTPDVSGTVPTVDRLRIGADVASNYLNGHVAKIQYWPARFIDAQLQLISVAPSFTVQGVTTIYGSTTVV